MVITAETMELIQETASLTKSTRPIKIINVAAISIKNIKAMINKNCALDLSTIPLSLYLENNRVLKFLISTILILSCIKTF